MQEKIYVIVPVYNVEAYLRRCVDSILAQTYKNLQLILVDDGSSDGSPAICDEYAKKDDRIYVIHKENGGVSSARNIAMQYAQKSGGGGYITFVDSDDWVHPEYLEALHKGITLTDDIDMSICSFVRVTECADTVAYQSLEWYVFPAHKMEDKKCAREIWRKLYRTECLRDSYFDEKLIYGEDTYFILDLIVREKVKVCALTENAYYNYFQRTESAVHSLKTNSRWGENLLYIEKYLDICINNPNIAACVYSCFCKILCQIRYKVSFRSNKAEYIMANKLCRKISRKVLFCRGLYWKDKIALTGITLLPTIYRMYLKKLYPNIKESEEQLRSYFQSIETNG